MSMDNGHIIRKNAAGKFVLQGYSMSSDTLPDVEKAPADQQFDTLEAAADAYEAGGEYPYGRYCDEYGLTISLMIS
jgi:hypothetical protein